MSVVHPDVSNPARLIASKSVDLTEHGRQIMTRMIQGMAIALVAVLAAGCGGIATGASAAPSAAAIDKAPVPPITLRIATVDELGQPIAAQLAYFADQVSKLSNGNITLTTQLDPDTIATFDDPIGKLLDKMKSNDLDMLAMPSQSWDAHGVTSLKALEAPFLITSDGLMNQIATSDLAKPMLDGLSVAGVKGLALWPEALRHPLSFNAPILSLADFKGSTIRTPLADAVDPLMSVLGAKAAVLNGPSLAQAQAAGALRGVETSYARTNLFHTQGTVTGNITFFPRMITLAISDAADARLSDAQRAVLTAAAVATTQHLVQTNASDAAAGATYCSQGGRIVLAAEADVSVLEQAGQPVVQALSKDPTTADLISKIQALAATEPATTFAATCEPKVVPSASPAPSPSAAPLPSGPPAALLPSGVYRTNRTVAEMLAAGSSQKDAQDWAGLITLTVTGTTWSETWDSPYLSGEAALCAGTQSVKGTILHVAMDRLVDADPITETSGNCFGFWDITWTMTNGQIVAKAIDDDASPVATATDKALWELHPWKKIQ